MSIVLLVLLVLVGLTVGITARFLDRSSSDRGDRSNPLWSWFISIALGILGSGLGAFFGRVIGLYRESDPGGLFAAIFGALLLVHAHQALTRRRRWLQEREIR